MQKIENISDLMAHSYQVRTKCQIQYLLSCQIQYFQVNKCRITQLLFIYCLKKDMHEIWNKVCHESSLKKKWIKELDEIYAKYESERKYMVCGLYYVKRMLLQSVDLYTAYLFLFPR